MVATGNTSAPAEAPMLKAATVHKPVVLDSHRADETRRESKRIGLRQQ